MTRRSLALTHEAGRHWFRRSLPPHVFSPPEDEISAPDEDREAAERWRLSGSDWRSFLNVYCAGFLSVIAFIA